MLKSLIFFFAFIPTILFSQKTIQIVDLKNKETYSVLKSDKKIKHGYYELLNYNNNPLLTGFYKFGAKDSIWNCYNEEGLPYLKYNYTLKELIYYNQKNSKQLNFQYKIINQNNNDTILSRPPIYLNGAGYMLYLLNKNIEYPKEAIKNNISGKVYVLFTVNKLGETSNYRISNPIGYGCDEEAIRVIKLMTGWLPGLVGDEKVDVEIAYPLKFALQF